MFLEQTQNLYRETPISEATAQAYLATPRHCFVIRYREWGAKEWHAVNPNSLAEHVATLYANRPLILFGEDDQNVPSTISQPSFVLRMLDLLQLKAGDKVFELGTGSGWSAALMGHLVGPEGHVVSLEIIPELAQSAGQTIESLGISNVHIVAGDGAEGYEDSVSYSIQAIFTAGAFDLPRHFYEQLREEGLLLVVIKTEGGGDNLFLMRKTGDHFESLESQLRSCSFEADINLKIWSQQYWRRRYPSGASFRARDRQKTLLVGWQRKRVLCADHPGHPLLSRDH